MFHNLINLFENIVKCVISYQLQPMVSTNVWNRDELYKVNSKQPRNVFLNFEKQLNLCFRIPDKIKWITGTCCFSIDAINSNIAQLSTENHREQQHFEVVFHWVFIEHWTFTISPSLLFSWRCRFQSTCLLQFKNNTLEILRLTQPHVCNILMRYSYYMYT